jgi:hypothetical protein
VLDQQMAHQIKCLQAKPNQQLLSPFNYSFAWYWTTWVSTLTANVATTSIVQQPYIIKPNKQATINANYNHGSLLTWI